MGIIGTLAAGFLVSFGLRAAPAGVLVAYESGVEAFSQALNGLKAGLGPGNLHAMDVRAAGAGSELARSLSARDARLLVAMGSESVALVRSRNPGIPVVATMVLHAPDDNLGAHVILDLPLQKVLGVMRVLLPQHRRVGIIRSRLRAYETAEILEAAARKEGFTAIVVDCEGPGGLLKAVATFSGRVDILLCLPDAELYNAVTIKPLMLASLGHRLPVVGFSPAFVRAGAVVGIYPDYEDIGRQTAEMALRIMRGEGRGFEEGPRKVHAAVNERVARLLGIDLHIGVTAFEVFR
ncbi:MAG: hypothetical protein C5B51_09030 [Terriglobia bacterium]|nr:MAG: hypothetical protein C5B51_09030 [Terriglobia bacterium]